MEPDIEIKDVLTQGRNGRGKGSLRIDWRNIRSKMIWTWAPRSTKEASESTVRNFLLHWFPSKITKQSFSWSYSFYLGTISAVLFAILAVTGVILTFFYIPSMERAYWSVKDIEYAVSFGSYIRAVHRWSAHLMVAVVFLHMVRTFLTASYKTGLTVGSKREVNWIVGIFLLLTTLFLSFTGYLLPMDQLAYWAITVGSNIAAAAPVIGDKIKFLLLGGNIIDQATVLRFYVLHIMVLPIFLTAAFSYHMWRIRKDGGLAVLEHLMIHSEAQEVPLPQTKTYSLLGVTKGIRPSIISSAVIREEGTVSSSPNLTRRILIVVLACYTLTSLLAILSAAPLEEPASPYSTPAVAKAPWYFLWLQELVSDTTIRIGPVVISGGFIGGILLPGLLLVLLTAWPWLDKSPSEAVGVWFHKSRIRQNMVFLIIAILLVILIIIGTFMRGPGWHFYWPWESWPEPPTVF